MSRGRPVVLNYDSGRFGEIPDFEGEKNGKSQVLKGSLKRNAKRKIVFLLALEQK